MTAQTPLYGIKYIQQGEPVRNTRQALEDNAFSIENALKGRGLAPQEVLDALSVIGRVGALEALTSPPWLALPLASGLAGVSGFQVPQMRLKGDRVELRGVIGAVASNATVATIPTALRPKATDILTSTSDATGNNLYVYADGRLNKNAGATGFLPLTGMVWYIS